MDPMEEKIDKKTWFWRKYCLALIFVLFACSVAYRPTTQTLKMVKDSGGIYDFAVWRSEIQSEIQSLQEECAGLEEELGVAEQ